MSRFFQQVASLVVTGVFLAFSINTINAAEIEAEVTSIDSQAGKVTVTYRAALGKTTATLDVSKKATVKVNGQTVSLKEVKPGHKVILNYNKDFAVVTEILASGDPKVLEFITVQEINGSYGSLTEDGKRIFYEVYGVPNSNGPVLFSSQRQDCESYFQGHQRLFPGRHPATTGDGLELVFLGKVHPSATERTLHSARRESLDKSFQRATEVRELRMFKDPKCPVLTPDGLTLCFFDTADDGQLLITTRSNRNSSWNVPRPLIAKSVKARLQGGLTWPWLSEDGLTLICCVEANPKYQKNLLIMNRKNKATPFVDYEFLDFDVENMPSLFRCPRYLPETEELFVTGHPKVEPVFQIGVIKNFMLPSHDK